MSVSESSRLVRGRLGALLSVLLCGSVLIRALAMCGDMSSVDSSMPRLLKMEMLRLAMSWTEAETDVPEGKQGDEGVIVIVARDGANYCALGAVGHRLVGRNGFTLWIANCLTNNGY